MPSQAPSDPRQTLADNLRAARLSAGLTQRQLAEHLDVEQMQISKWERGIHRPSDENLAALTQVFGCSMAWLYTRRGVAA